ncbi:unnamed protein product [Symbiodinium sp. CCMP2456]|nr:unnamed protein product [Symbiodinium sp. CCMP2456]
MAEEASREPSLKGKGKGPEATHLGAGKGASPPKGHHKGKSKAKGGKGKGGYKGEGSGKGTPSAPSAVQLDPLLEGVPAVLAGPRAGAKPRQEVKALPPLQPVLLEAGRRVAAVPAADTATEGPAEGEATPWARRTARKKAEAAPTGAPAAGPPEEGMEVDTSVSELPTATQAAQASSSSSSSSEEQQAAKKETSSSSTSSETEAALSTTGAQASSGQGVPEVVATTPRESPEPATQATPAVALAGVSGPEGNAAGGAMSPTSPAGNQGVEEAEPEPAGCAEAPTPVPVFEQVGASTPCEAPPEPEGERQGEPRLCRLDVSCQVGSHLVVLRMATNATQTVGAVVSRARERADAPRLEHASLHAAPGVALAHAATLGSVLPAGVQTLLLREGTGGATVSGGGSERRALPSLFSPDQLWCYCCGIGVAEPLLMQAHAMTDRHVWNARVYVRRHREGHPAP